MANSSIWTVRPSTVTKELVYVDGEGNRHQFSIDVVRQLTVGESRRVMMAGWRGVRQGKAVAGEEPQGTEIQIDWRQQSFARTETYLKGWSLTDDAGKKLPIARDVLESLHPDVYTLIEDAISAHVESSEQEKKAKSGEPSPSTTSD